MTVGQKMHQTLASIDEAAANMKEFALNTEDKHAEQMFNEFNRQLEVISEQMKNRICHLEENVPVYRILT